MPTTLHLIANAHLDPVWLWDRHEGLNQGIATCRTMLDLLDEDPDFTFIRGEAAIYEHLERFDPKTFARIAAYVDSGRWEIVGGNYIQPDTNLPATETLARHFLRGQGYFQSRFGKTPRIAWAATPLATAPGCRRSSRRLVSKATPSAAQARGSCPLSPPPSGGRRRAVPAF